jgi:hypothetical protein
VVERLVHQSVVGVGNEGWGMCVCKEALERAKNSFEMYVDGSMSGDGEGDGEGDCAGW